MLKCVRTIGAKKKEKTNMLNLHSIKLLSFAITLKYLISDGNEREMEWKNSLHFIMHALLCKQFYEGMFACLYVCIPIFATPCLQPRRNKISENT